MQIGNKMCLSDGNHQKKADFQRIRLADQIHQEIYFYAISQGLYVIIGQK